MYCTYMTYLPTCCSRTIWWPGQAPLALHKGHEWLCNISKPSVWTSILTSQVTSTQELLKTLNPSNLNVCMSIFSSRTKVKSLSAAQQSRNRLWRGKSQRGSAVDYVIVQFVWTVVSGGEEQPIGTGMRTFKFPGGNNGHWVEKAAPHSCGSRLCDERAFIISSVCCETSGEAGLCEYESQCKEASASPLPLLWFTQVIKQEGRPSCPGYSHQDGSNGVVHVAEGRPAQQLSEAAFSQCSWVLLTILTCPWGCAGVSRPVGETQTIQEEQNVQ